MIYPFCHLKYGVRRGIITSCFLSLLLFPLVNFAAAQELALFQKIPPDLLRYTGGAAPDENGLVGYNRDGFKSPEFQRGAMLYMIRAVVRGNPKGIDAGWRAIDAAFQHQSERGNFSLDGTPHGGPSAVAFWLADLCQAVLILQESEFGPQYKNRIEQVAPKIQRAARWLAKPRYQEYLLREDAVAPNRLLFDALAYGLSGKLLGDEELKKLGRRFVDQAMTQYRACDGVFLEKGGHDSSYQAVAALKLQIWAVHFPDPDLEKAVDRAVSWEIGRVCPDGRVDASGNTRTGLGQEKWMGRDKDVNLSEVTLCLLYYNARTSNAPALDAARRIVDRRRDNAAKFHPLSTTALSSP